MSRVRKYLSIAALVIAFLFCFGGPAAMADDNIPTTVSQTVSVHQTTGDGAVVKDPGALESYGPVGVITGLVLTGALTIVKAVGEARKLDVSTYKERAVDAETRADGEIGKVHKKLAELEVKLDEVIRDRDEYRDDLENRKAQFTQQVLELEKRHQVELEEMHANLLIELHTRHRLERLLAEHGIAIPDTPPPYTKEMKEEVLTDLHLPENIEDIKEFAPPPDEK